MGSLAKEKKKREKNVGQKKEAEQMMEDKTHDNLMRRPVLGFFDGRSPVGVAARDPTVELPSLNEKAKGDETVMSTSSALLLLLGRLLADRVDRVLMGATREYRVLLVLLAGVTSSRSSSSPLRTELSRAV